MTTQRRKMFWVDRLLNQDVASDGEVHLDLITGESIAGVLTDLTLIRTILCLDIHYSLHDAGEGYQNWNMGIFVQSREAAAANIAPDPNVAADHPQAGWVFRCGGVIHGFAADQPAAAVRTVERDIRAMRKLNRGVLSMILNNDPATGVASSIRFTGIVRCLYKMP